MMQVIVFIGFFVLSSGLFWSPVVALAAERSGSGTLASAETPAIAYPLDLPPLREVEAMLRAHPAIAAGRAGLRAEQGNARRLEAGAAEFTLRLGTQKRRETTLGSNWSEWDVAMDRPIRSNSKAELDARIGKQGVVGAEFALGDAMHESGRALLRSWMGLLREQAQRSEWQAQEALLQRQRDLVARRVRAGDAPRMELSLAEAALAQVEAQRQQMQGRLLAAQAEFVRLFPGVGLPAESAAQPLPQAPTQPLAYWRERILAHNHELALVRSEAQRMRLLASRAEADRLGDPSVGMRVASERGGIERIGGLYVSIPLPGEARRAAADSSSAQADAALQREAVVLRRLEAEIAAGVERAAGSFLAWQRAAAAAEGLLAHATLMERAYALGESALPEVLNARRVAREAALGAALARLETLETRYRLLLDAHLLWPLDDD